MRSLAAALVGAVALGLAAPAAGAATGTPAIGSSASKGAPGASIIVQLSGWTPRDVLTVQVCGNDGLRGSGDCDLIGGESVNAGPEGTTRLRIFVGRPPAPCPCVLRASDVATQEVATTPFEVVGNAVGPLVKPSSASLPPPLTAQAALPERPMSFVGRLRRVLGGPSRRELVLEVHNSSSYALDGVVVTAALGRHSSGGAPLDAPPPFDLTVGQTHTLALPVKLVAPVHGRYVVAGQIYVNGQSVPFSVAVSSTPWGLVVLALLVVVAVIGIVAVALRSARSEPIETGTGPEGEHQVTDPGTLREQGPVDPSRGKALS